MYEYEKSTYVYGYILSIQAIVSAKVTSVWGRSVSIKPPFIVLYRNGNDERKGFWSYKGTSWGRGSQKSFWLLITSGLIKTSAWKLIRNNELIAKASDENVVLHAACYIANQYNLPRVINGNGVHFQRLSAVREPCRYEFKAFIAGLDIDPTLLAIMVESGWMLFDGEILQLYHIYDVSQLLTSLLDAATICSDGELAQ